MTPTLELVGGPYDGQQYGHARPWPVLGPGSLPLREIAGRDLTGYSPARHNGHHWVSEWLYVKSGWRGSSYCDGNQATDSNGRRHACGLGCPSLYRRPAPPPPAG